MNDRSKVVVKVPHRITGFFEIVDSKHGIKITNPEKIGSRGAGFTLNAIGKTTIISEKLKKDKEEGNNCKIFINNTEVYEEAETTNYIFNFLKNSIPKNQKVEIIHDFDLPVGCGYGASGSGALGTVYGLNKLFDLKLSAFECGRIAHVAEVINKTGLGTVCGQLSAGLGMVARPGYPCKYHHIDFPRDIRVVCTSFGAISTKEFLTNKSLHSIVNEPGKKALEKLKDNPNIKNFAQLSREFVEETKILEILHLTKIRSFINELNKQGIIGASLNQLGKSIFAICKEKSLEKVKSIFESYQLEEEIYILKIDEKGLRIF